MGLLNLNTCTIIIGMRLSYRIILAIVCLVFVTGSILSTYSLSAQKELITSQLDKKGQVLTNLLAASVRNDLLSYDFYAIKLLFDSLYLDSDVVSVSLTGPDNYIKMHSDLSKLGEISPYNFEDGEFQSKQTFRNNDSKDGSYNYMFFSPVKIDQSRTGIIHITLSDRESLLLIKTFENRMLILTALVLITGILAAYLISRQISKPIIELTREIQLFMMNRPDHGRNDFGFNEITILKKTFHVMMEEIEKSIEYRVKNEKMAVLGNLSSVLAHEVKNPLEPIKGSAEILKLKHPDNTDIVKYSRIIQDEVSGLISFLDNFLDVAKSSCIKYRQVDINSLLEDILHLMEYTINKENIHLELILEKELPYVPGDSGMLKQVFLNLLINAVQAKSGEKGLIEIRTDFIPPEVNIRIKDYGCGIENSIQEEIFRPFFSTKSEGSGIGLSTSKHIVSQHNGRMKIFSESGSWTEVNIFLPVGEVGMNEA